MTAPRSASDRLRYGPGMDLEALLRRAIALSARAREHGNHPFGALLAAPGGRIALEAENTVVTDGDPTAHAETNLVRAAAARFGPNGLGDLTLVTSCEPCAMCAGAIHWAGVRAVVYGLSERSLLALAGPDDPANPTLDLPCRTVFAAGDAAVEVTGPLLEDEASVPHEGFWG